MYPIQYHSLFISYSTKDELLARRLHADLQANGVRCWFASEDIKTGEKIRDRINQEIHVQETFLLLLSKYSVASTWVEYEVEAALEKEYRQKRAILFPIRIDDSVFQSNKGWATGVRSLHITDFRNWEDPQTYTHAFKKLLADLKRSEPLNHHSEKGEEC
jgi:hypothetical protein